MITLLKLYWKELIIYFLVFCFGVSVCSIISKQRYQNLQITFLNYQKTIAESVAERERKTAEAIQFYIDSKTKSDENYQNTINGLNSDVARLRRQRSEGGYLPRPSESSSEPNRICFDRAKLDDAIGQLDDEISKIAERSDHYGLRLVNIKEWYKSLKK